MNIPIPVLVSLALLLLIAGYSLRGSSISQHSKSVYQKASLIKDYWKFIFIFVVLLGIVYWIVFESVPEINLSRALDLVGTIATLVFAIFVGWFAFIEVKKTSVEKGVVLAHQFLTANGGSASQRARHLYEEYCNFDQNDFSNLAELLELYIILGGYEKEFEIRLTRLKQNAKDDWEKIVPFYLDSARYILREDTGTAKKKLIELVNFAKENPDALKNLTWRFDEIKSAKSYNQLAPGSDSKIIFDSMILYLGGNEEKRIQFENYIFKPPVFVEAVA